MADTEIIEKNTDPVPSATVLVENAFILNAIEELEKLKSRLEAILEEENKEKK